MKNLLRTARNTLRFSWLNAAEETAAALGVGSRALFFILSGLLMFSTVGLVYEVRSKLVVGVPARGGSLSEGLIGSPRFINPVLAISDADRDLTALVYSGLLRATPKGGYETDLAESYEITPDGKTYTFILRENLTFHDGTTVTAEDVAYTVQKAQDPALKSPLRANWDGVAVAAVDARTVQFTLRSAYAPFIENLTLGILPKARWSQINDEEFPFSELNAEPIGSGPYEVDAVSRTSSGIPSTYSLHSFGNYALGEPYLSRFVLHFYQSESALVTALSRGDIDSASGISPANLGSLPEEDIRTSPLNRVFAVFLNQNQSTLLRDKAVRMALNSSISRDELVAQVLGGYGTPLTGPVPAALLETRESTATTSSEQLIKEARAMLTAKGWSPREDGILQKTTGTGKNASTVTLEFDLATANVPELRAAAEYLRAAWGKMGVLVNVKIFEQGDLSQNIIRPRKYDALLFGEVIGRELDLFAFWHSSQRNDPGLNIAGYANSTADKALESLRQTNDPTKRREYLGAFLGELTKDLPAIFLYAPDFVYSVPNDIAGVDLGFIETPDDRFLSLPQWHRETDEVWPFFAVKKDR